MGEKSFVINISPDSDEDRIWRGNIKPLLEGINKNINDICHYGFTEMLNNAIEHSEGTEVCIDTACSDEKLRITITDNGIGIFNNIKNKFEFEDERHAVFELSKGKLTTDPESHTGEGIFFTSRMFDKFVIKSSNLSFIHENFEKDDWLVENLEENFEGTRVSLTINPKSKRTVKAVFDKYTDDISFAKTHILLFLAQYGDDNLVSRSQAKRVLARADKFKEILLDFSNVEMIGQGFADQIFRVFRNAHPDITVTRSHANNDIEKMIHRVYSDRE
ncbi:MAG: DUF4325 domain-containing protein [Desulfobacteraceae bacterium]|nr:DUF4325 domain-containing protein [Desulfobacteraceae bacterium]